MTVDQVRKVLHNMPGDWPVLFFSREYIDSGYVDVESVQPVCAAADDPVLAPLSCVLTDETEGVCPR